MINISKEFFNITFQNPTGFGIILTDNIDIFFEFIDCPVRAFFISARIGICDESFVKKWIENSVDGMVQKPIAHAGFVNISWFLVIDFESLITAVIVGMIDEVTVERENIVHKTH